MASNFEFPDGTPEFFAAAVLDLDDNAQALLRKLTVSPEVARGYFMAVCDLKDKLLTECALEKARAEEAKAVLLADHQRKTSGEYS